LNVVFLLLGMVVIVSVMRETGKVEYLAIRAAKKARGRPFPLMVLSIIIAAVGAWLTRAAPARARSPCRARRVPPDRTDRGLQYFDIMWGTSADE
jgi:hypothetical protein